MKRIFQAVMLFLATVVAAQAQNLTTVSGSNITDLGGNKLPLGQLCFAATDQQNQAISFQIGGGGQAMRKKYCSTVTAGVVTSFTVPNPAATSPTGIYYHVTVQDSTGMGGTVIDYPLVSFTGATFNFDNYAPLNLGSAAPLTGTSVTGNLSVTGNVAATGTVTGSNIPGNILQQIFNAGTGLTQRTALNFFSGITCVDNAGTSRTDCRLGPLVTVASSATPVFDCNNGNNFKNVLTANVTSSTLVNCAAGQPVAILVVENATGGFTFVPPANVQGWLPISTAANANNLQIFLYDGSNAQPGQVAGLTGDVTSSPGSTATTVAKIQGTTVTGTTGSGAAVLSTSPALTKLVANGTGTNVNAAIQVTGATPNIDIQNTGGGVDAKWWDLSATTTQLLGRIINDANNNAVSWLNVTRSGLTITGITFGAGSGVQTLPTATGTLSIGNPNKQIFTASGTFTIPTGATGVKVTVVGGGGAGGGGNGANAGGGGGGAGGLAFKWLSGLTPGLTIAVTVGAGGTGNVNATGNTGAASSIASGTQTITTVTANGGVGGVGGNAGANSGGAGGTATNGDINFPGNAGNLTWLAAPNVGALGGAGPFGGGPLQQAAAVANTGAGGGGNFANAGGFAGGSGIVIFEWVQ